MIQRVLWLKMVLENLKIQWDGPTRLYYNNKSVISIAYILVRHNRAEHIFLFKKKIELSTLR